MSAHINGGMNGHARFDGLDFDSFRRDFESAEHMDTTSPDPKHGLEFDADIILDTASRDIIKPLLAPGDLAVMFGPSGAGKTFCAIAAMYAIAQGRPFFKRRTQAAASLYVTVEGQRGTQRRLRAMVSVYGSAGKMIARLTLSVSLDKSPNGVRGVADIVAAVKRLASLARVPVGLIVLDTLARVIAPDDENNAQDMGALIARVTQIVKATGAAVLVIHHTGKDATRGMRGSSALYAAADLVLEINTDKLITVAKCKDGETGPLGNYTLKRVTLGVDDDGDEITSCVLEEVQETPAKAKTAKLTSTEGRALEMLTRLYNDGQDELVDAANLDLADGPFGPRLRAVRRKLWHEKCDAAKLTASENKDSKRDVFSRQVRVLTGKGVVGHFGDFVWLTRQNPTSADNSREVNKYGQHGGPAKPDNWPKSEAGHLGDTHPDKLSVSPGDGCLSGGEELTPNALMARHFGATRKGLVPGDASALARQARHDVEAAAAEYAALADGRCMSLFPLVCRVGKYAAHGAISPATIRALFNDAARHNGALKKYGPRWLDAEISRALARCTNDAIPPIARCFRAQNPQRQELRP